MTKHTHHISRTISPFQGLGVSWLRHFIGRCPMLSYTALSGLGFRGVATIARGVTASLTYIALSGLCRLARKGQYLVTKGAAHRHTEHHPYPALKGRHTLTMGVAHRIKPKLWDNHS